MALLTSHLDKTAGLVQQGDFPAFIGLGVIRAASETWELRGWEIIRLSFSLSQTSQQPTGSINTNLSGDKAQFIVLLNREVLMPFFPRCIQVTNYNILSNSSLKVLQFDRMLF